MPAEPSTSTSQRLLALLSLLQSTREWAAPALGERLEVTPRTIRRDIDRLRVLGYTIETTRGPVGGYRLAAGSQLPPLLFDDEQALAVAITLRTARLTGAVAPEAAAAALRTITRLMPPHLAERASRVEVAAAGADPGRPRVDPGVLLRIGEAIQAHRELRFDYSGSSGARDPGGPPRRVEPHHLLLHDARWYLISWSPDREDWRVHRVDRMRLRSHTGRAFHPRVVPGADAAAFLAGRFRGSEEGGSWPCVGRVVLHLPASRVVPFAGDGIVEDLGPDRCAYESGSWSWIGLAASLGRFDAELEVVGPSELRDAFAELSRRFARAG